MSSTSEGLVQHIRNRNCGYIVIGTEAPDVCPVCFYPQAYFEINAENY